MLTISESQAILAALDPQTRAERQRVVDLAVRFAMTSDYCDTFNRLLSEILPEMCVWFNSTPIPFNSDGRSCHGHRFTWYVENYGQPGSRVRTYNVDGYDQDGQDRDGFNVRGYDVNGYDVNGYYQNTVRDHRDTPGYGTEPVYTSGYGRYSNLDAEGNRRIGRGPTPEEAERESATQPEGPYNPTTWAPAEAEAEVTVSA